MIRDIATSMARRPSETPTLTKAELAELLFEQVGLNKREAKDMVESFLRRDPRRARARRQRQAVRLRQLPVARQAAAPGRNPKTGEAIPITARRVVTFHASQKLKGMVEATLKALRADVAPARPTPATANSTRLDQDGNSRPAADPGQALLHDR